MKTLQHVPLGIAGLLAATPLFAASGDSTISTILGLWPYITGLILVLLAFLWYQQIRTWQQHRKDENRRPAKRPNQIIFLSLITVFAGLMLIAPTVLKRIETVAEQQTQHTMDPQNRTEITLQVEGMTCVGCENAVINRVAGINGVESVEASHTAKQATIVYDKTKTNPEAIAQTIEDVGYKVVE